MGGHLRGSLRILIENRDFDRSLLRLVHGRLAAQDLDGIGHGLDFVAIHEPVLVDHLPPDPLALQRGDEDVGGGTLVTQTQGRDGQGREQVGKAESLLLLLGWEDLGLRLVLHRYQKADCPGQDAERQGSTQDEAPSGVEGDEEVEEIGFLLSFRLHLDRAP